jgi:MazG family protein
MQGDSALGRAVALVRDLRSRCPWDAAQTPQTLRPYLVEETLELDQAIRHDDAGAVREELGDLLLNLAFQIVIAEERGQFGAEAVTRGLEEKMWRRHPHLFGLGDKPASWEHGKQGSRERGAGSGTLRGLPDTLPPLLMAYRLQERAAGVGFDWPDASGPMEKVKEETAELEHEVAREGTTHHAPRTTHTSAGDRVTVEIGDLLFAVVNLARKLGIEPGQALEQANDKFRARFGAVERLASERGFELGRASLAELDAIWNEVKRAEESPR